jgi:hypothetical protein
LGASGFYVGANLKAVRGQIGYSQFQMLQDGSGKVDALKQFTDNSTVSVKPAMDIGLLYELRGSWHLRAGLTLRNINNPGFETSSFAQANGESSVYHLNGQARAGVAVNPANWWTLAADLDVTKNHTLLPGHDSRELSVGSEFNIVNRPAFNIPLRVGMMKNVANSGSDVSFTAGTGLNMLSLHIDIAGSASKNTTTLDGKTVPTNASAAASAALLF